MRVLCVYDPQNTFWGTLRRFKKDGDEFGLQCGYATEYYVGQGHDVDTFVLPKGTAMAKRLALFSYLRGKENSTYRRILFFCHGAKRHLNRKMISDLNVSLFSTILSDKLTMGGKVVFFSCLTGALLDGFASRVAFFTQRDVIAHFTRGHTTKNPHKVLFTATESECTYLWKAHGGWRKLKKKLKTSDFSPFRFIEEIFR